MINKVIIIEDDAVLRQSIHQMLELEDMEPIATMGFVQAKRIIRSNFRGVVLSDIRMPDQDGFAVLHLAQSRDEDLPVVMLTGHSDVPTAMRAMREGAYDYLEKPCDPAQLIGTLRRALDHRALVLANREMRRELDQTEEDDEQGSLAERLERRERKIIEAVLARENGKVARAAEVLGIPRNTLYDRMAKLQLVAKSFRDTSD